MVLDTPSSFPMCLKLRPSLRKDLAISTFRSVIFRGVPRVLPLLRALSRPALVLLRMLSSSCCAAQVKKLARSPRSLPRVSQSQRRSSVSSAAPKVRGI